MARSSTRPTTRQRATVSKAEKVQFAERLRALMEQRGLTIAETARRVRKLLPEGEGFDDTNLIHYRQGRSVPRPGHLEALSRALGVRSADLIVTHARRMPSDQERDPRSPLRSEAAELNVLREAATDAKSRSAIQAIEDHGEKVLLRFEQLVPWSVALQILHALKDARDAEESPN